jgi:hypothetical protein
MLTLKDSVRIEKPPEVIFNWFDNFVKNYKSWHPGHVKAVWLKGDGFRKDSILYSEEYLGGKLEKLRFKIIDYRKGKEIKYKVLFPESIVCSGGAFVVKSVKGGSVFTATLSFRWGFLLSRLFPRKLEAIKAHMREEGENLKKLLEK